MPTRQIVKIDEELCTGCGECVPSCAEGALEIIDGKVKVHEERLCDGLGACLGRCPIGALTIEEREAPGFDEAAVVERLGSLRGTAPPAGASRRQTAGERSNETMLHNWPVQLGLVNPYAPSFRDADLLLAADCTPTAYRLFHEDFLDGRSMVIACPKLDDLSPYVEKLAELLRVGKPRSLTVVRMEVPCCRGLVRFAELAAQAADYTQPVREVVVTVEGGLQTGQDR